MQFWYKVVKGRQFFLEKNWDKLLSKILRILRKFVSSYLGNISIKFITLEFFIKYIVWKSNIKILFFYLFLFKVIPKDSFGIINYNLNQ